MRVFCPNLVFSTILVSQLLVINGAVGQNRVDPNSDVWREIEQSDAQMQKSRTEWKLLHLNVPDARGDIDATAERAAAQVKSQGASEKAQKSFAAAARESAQQQKSGFVFRSVLEITRNSSATLCDVVQNAPESNSKENLKPSVGKAHFIDYYDGKNMVFLEGMQSDNLLRGELIRQKNAVLKHSIPTIYHELFLTGNSITKVFPPSNTVIKKESGYGLVLETQTQQQLSDEISIPIILRATISKKVWRPLHLEIIRPNEKNIVVQKFEASDYQRLPDGVWFPRQIDVFQLYGKGTPISPGRVATENDFFYKDTYTLVRADFGGRADVSVLNSPIPQGPIIADSRFAPRSSVRYKAMKGVLPDDAKIMRMLEEQEQEQAQDAAQQKQQKRQQFALFGLPLGALIVGLGVVFWMRSRRSTKA